MKRLLPLVLFGFAMLGLSVPAGQAGPLDAKQVPAGAKWVFHIDVDALRDSAIGHSIHERLQANNGAMRKIDELEAFTGMQFPEDLHGVTLFGTDANPNNAIAIFDAAVDKDRLLDIVRVGTDMTSAAHGDHEVLGWTDKGQQRYGAFHTDQRIVMSQSEAAVKQALDLLDGKAAAVAADASLLAGNKQNLIMYVAATDLMHLKQAGMAKSPLAGQLEEAWIATTQDGDNLQVIASGIATTPETAEQLKTALEGIRSMVQLAGGDPNAGDRERVGAAAMAELSATTAGKSININWTIPVAVANEAMDLAHKRKATTQP